MNKQINNNNSHNHNNRWDSKQIERRSSKQRYRSWVYGTFMHNGEAVSDIAAGSGMCMHASMTKQQGAHKDDKAEASFES